MGTATEWQKTVEKRLSNHDVIVYNPRRDDWDSSWVQSIANPQFKEQVDWELSYLEKASIVFFNFDKSGQSPITLMELGYIIGRKIDLFCNDSIVVCCPDGFWRKGNVEVLCDRFGVKVHNYLGDAIKELEKLVDQRISCMKD